MTKPFEIKVCGMTKLENIQLLAELPIDYIGHIFYKKSARYAGNLKPVSLPSSIKKVGVFVNATHAEVIEKAKEHQLCIVQLHGNETAEQCAALKAEGLKVFKAFGIDQQFTWDQITAYHHHVDRFLFDSKSPQYGGTGLRFNWDFLTHYKGTTPYFLSGGLSLDNLHETRSINDERLIGLDLNSKFEISPGIKDIERVKTALKVIQHEQISSK